MALVSQSQAMDETAFPLSLTKVFGEPLPDLHSRAWAALSPAQKLRATKRLDALERWHGDRRGWTIDDAAKAADMGKNHFYALAARWEDVEARSLEVLGVQARAPRRRKSRHDKVLNEVRSIAEDLVGKEPEDVEERPAVTTVMAELEARWTPKDGKLPGAATLRGVIVEARRRRDMKSRIGGDLGFDICAVEIPDDEGKPYIAFICVDRGTGYIHGYRFDDVADSIGGHARLATDILAHGSDEEAEARLPWVERNRQVELVIGEDREPFREWEAQMKADIASAAKDGPAKVDLNASNKPRRFGRYLREALGTRIGRVNLLPARTVSKPGAPPAAPLADIGYTEAEAVMRLDLEVDDHNAAIVAQLSDEAPSKRMPEHLRNVFGLIAEGARKPDDT